MSDMLTMVRDSADRLFADHCTPAVRDAAEAGVWPGALWQEAEALGLCSGELFADGDGDTLGLAGLGVVARLAGEHALPLPLVETQLAARWLARAGLPVPAGPLGIAAPLAAQRPVLAGGRLSGSLRRVPWGRDVRAVVFLATGETGPVLVCLAGAPVSRRAANLAAEPRDDIELDGVAVPASAMAAWPADEADLPRFEAALFRSLQTAGALARVLALCVRYCGERVQFGRPIGRFQAVQHQVAGLASQLAAASVSADAALLASARGAARFPIAAAKIAAAQAAGAAFDIAHQVHGAMGFTYEHPLHRSTRRLVAWRDEFGNEAQWSAWIGRLVYQAGEPGLWPLVTDPERVLAGLDVAAP